MSRSGGVGLIAIAVLLASSASSAKPDAPAGTAGTGAVAGRVTKVAITLTPGGCAPQPPSVSAGDIEFDVENKNATGVSAAELRSSDGAQLLADKKDLEPGASGSFTSTLKAGYYRIACPGAQQATWELRVTGPDVADAWRGNPELVQAVRGYGTWVREKVSELAANTDAFTAAVKAGRIDQAKILYPKARVDYESVEPVAEAFGDLDKEIDGRIQDFLDPANFSGFHRLERAVFTDNSVSGMTPIADRLLQNIKQLQQLVAKQQYSPIELVGGATDLVNEIEESKITGEEERYSGIDLVDFRGNLDGAMQFVSQLAPFLKKNDPALLTAINARNHDVEAALAKYERTPGYVDSGFVNYSTVTDPERRQLSYVVNSLAEQISDLFVLVSK